MTTIKIERPDKVATKILRAIRLIDEGKELVPVDSGQWIVEEDGNSRIVTCPACGKEYACHFGMLQLQNFDHCPTCGSRMTR